MMRFTTKLIPKFLANKSESSMVRIIWPQNRKNTPSIWTNYIYPYTSLTFTRRSNYSTSKANGQENPKQAWLNDIKQKMKKYIKLSLGRDIKLKIKEQVKQILSDPIKWGVFLIVKVISEITFLQSRFSLFSLCIFQRLSIKYRNKSDLRGYTYNQKFAMIKDWWSINFEPELKQFVKDSVAEDVSKIVDQEYDPQKIMALYGRNGTGKSKGLINFVVEQMKKTTDRIPVLYVRLRRSSPKDTQKSSKHKSKNYVVPVEEILKSEKLNIISLLNHVSDDYYREFMKFLIKQGFHHKLQSDKKTLILIIDEANCLQPHLKQKDPLYIKAAQLLVDLYGLNLSSIQIVLVSSDQQFVYKEMVSVSTMRDDKFQVFQIQLSKKTFTKYLEIKGSRFGLDKDQKTLNLLTSYYNNKRDVENNLKIYEQIKLKQGQQKARQKVKKNIQQDLKQEYQKIKTIISHYPNIDKDLIQICSQYNPFHGYSSFSVLDQNHIIYNGYFKNLMLQQAYQLFSNEKSQLMIKKEAQKEFQQIKNKKQNKRTFEEIFQEKIKSWRKTECINNEGFDTRNTQKINLID